MPKRTKHKGSGSIRRARVGNVELALSGKTSTISVHRSDAEQQHLLDRIKTWRAGAPAEFKTNARELMRLLEPYRALSILGEVYYAQQVSDPESYAEWSHEGLGPKVEHIALLLAARPADGDHDLVPPDVVKTIGGYLDELFPLLLMYYEEVDGTRHPLDPDPRGLVLLDELFVRRPAYPRQHRETLRILFHPVEREMESLLGFRIQDAIAIDEAFEKLAGEAIRRCSMALRVSSRPLVPFAKKTSNGAIVDFAGDVETAARIRDEILTARASAMAAFGAELAVDSVTVASQARIEQSRADAVLRLFEATSADVDSNYFVPSPDSPLKRKPFLRFDGRWVLANQMLFLPAMQPTLERALNPAHGTTTASAAAWTKYVDARADALERWTADAVSSLLGGAVIHRNLKYKSVAGSKAHDELDAMALVDGKMLLIESKGGSFTVTARRGDPDAIEGNIEKLMTDAHEQALRAAAYVRSGPDPVFRENGREIRVDMSKVDEILLVTTTLEDLGHLTARFNDVARVPVSTVADTPWVVSIHDLQLIAKYTPNAPTFLHYLKRRIGLSAQPAFDAMSELDWYGRYLHDALNLTEFRGQLASGDVMTANLLSHTTVFDDFELYETGQRKTPARRPMPEIHPMAARLIQAIADWGGPGYINAGCLLLDLPPKLQRGFAKRIVGAGERITPGSIAQEVARTHDGDVAVACSICGPDVDADAVIDPAEYGLARRNVHVIMRGSSEVITIRRPGAI